MKRCFPAFVLLLFVLTQTSAPASQTAATPTDQYHALLKMLSRKEYARAMVECQALLERYPDFGKPLSKLLLIARATSQVPQTEAWLQTLVPTNPRAWYALGLLAHERGKHEEAFAMQQKCLEALPGFAPAAAALAQAAVALKAPARAEEFFKARPNEAVFLYGLGILSREQRQSQQAQAFYEQALQLQPRLLDALMEKTLVGDTPARRAETLVACVQLLALIDEREDPEERRLWLDFKGRKHYQLSQYPQTIQAMNEALRLAREYEWRDHEERALSFLGSSKLFLNYFSEALHDYQQALTLTRQGNLPFLSRNLGNIGLVYRNLGDLVKSAEYYQQAIDAGRSGSDVDSLRNFLLNLGYLYLETGAPQKAPPLFEEAAQLAQRAGDTWPTYLIQAGWARYHYFTRNYPASLKAAQAALQVIEQRSELLQQGRSLILIGDCHIELQDRAAAATAYQRALALGQKTQVLAVIWPAEAGLARLAQDTQPQEALQHYRRAIDAIEKIRTRQTSLEEKTGYFQDATDVYQQAVALLIQLHRRDAKQGHGAEAFHLAERIRARTLLDSLTETTAYLERKLEPDLLDRQQEIQRRLSNAEASLQRVVADPKAKPDTIRQLEAELLRAVNDYADWRKQVRQRNPYLAELTMPEPLTLEQTQAALK
ncbi:MAG TPA: tetratricopeptide repeat protein [Blastocatellia bacterium]|nr:tetratricopeptide repeat protein [Blastocatellia bacterium]